MCTAMVYKTKHHYFGRNLDLEYSYHETVTITPRNYPFHFFDGEEMETHYAMIGMAYVANNYPLYYDAVNEKGLGMAGLNFPGNACYRNCEEHTDNIAPYELIPWILGKCQSVQEARVLLAHTCIVEHNFSDELPAAPLHWIISDGENAVTVEATKSGLEIFDNPVGVLTNNPPFPYHMMNLNNYMNLTSQPPVNRFSSAHELKKYGSGMGGIGLPGDCSPASRFVRASFLKLNSVSGDSEKESVNQFFHILGNVEFTRGSVSVEEGVYDITVYSSCCNMEEGIYYYTTYENRRITGVDMRREDLDGKGLVSYPLLEEELKIQNEEKERTDTL